MRILKKSVLMLVTAATLSLVVFSLFATFVVLRSYKTIEQAEVRDTFTRAKLLLADNVEQLGRVAMDYGAWIDAYQFALNPKSDFPKQQITDDVFANVRANLIAYLDPQGKVLHSRTLDLLTGQPIPELASLERLLQENPRLKTLVTSSEGASGLLVKNGRILIVALGPIVQGRGKEPIVGHTLFARLLSPEELSEVGRFVGADLSLVPRGTALPNCPPHDTCYSTTIMDGKVIEAHAVQSDINGQPTLTLSVRANRTIWSTGLKAFHGFLLTAALLVILLAGIKFWFIRRFLISPLSNLTNRIKNLGPDMILAPSLTFQPRASTDNEMAILENTLADALRLRHDAEKRLLEETQRANDHEKLARVGEFACGIVHEINNPAMVAREQSALLAEALKSSPDPASQRLHRLAQRTSDSTQRIIATVSAIRVLNDNAAGESMQQAAASEILRITEMIFDDHPMGGRIHWVTRSLPDQQLSCIPWLLARALANLISNALHAIKDCPPETHVDVETVISGGCLQFRVLDDGAGIPASIRQDIMKPFFTTKAQGDGMGLGLSIVSKIAAQHGGHVYLDETPSRTCFVLEVPCGTSRNTSPEGDSRGALDAAFSALDSMAKEPT